LRFPGKKTNLGFTLGQKKWLKSLLKFSFILVQILCRFITIVPMRSTHNAHWVIMHNSIPYTLAGF
jgi:hypothetical protein